MWERINAVIKIVAFILLVGGARRYGFKRLRNKAAIFLLVRP